MDKSGILGISDWEFKNFHNLQNYPSWWISKDFLNCGIIRKITVTYRNQAKCGVPRWLSNSWFYWWRGRCPEGNISANILKQILSNLRWKSDYIAVQNLSKWTFKVYILFFLLFVSITRQLSIKNHCVDSASLKNPAIQSSVAQGISTSCSITWLRWNVDIRFVSPDQTEAFIFWLVARA